MLQELYGHRNGWIAGQTAVFLWPSRVVEHVNYARAPDAWRIIYAGVCVAGKIPQLLGASLSQDFHVLFCAEVQAASGARLNASGFQPFANAVRTERALVHAFGFRIELGNIKRAAGDTVATADAIGLLEIHNSIGVLHDGALRGTRF